jgi:hypothetical protein
MDFKNASGRIEKNYDIRLSGPGIYLTYGF